MRSRWFFGVSAVIGIGLGCNAILGIEDQPLRDDANGVTPDAASPVDAADRGDAAGASSRYAALIRDAGPSIYLRLGEKLAGEAAHDEVGNNDGVYPLAGVTLGVEGAIKDDPSSAVRLDGMTTIGMAPDGRADVDFAGKASFSVEVWLRPATGLPAYAYVVDNAVYEPKRAGWSLIAGTEGVFFERWANGVNGTSTEAPRLTEGVWAHVVATAHGEENPPLQRLYINGEAVKQSEMSATLPSVPGTFRLGGQNCECTGNKFKGDIDEVAIYPQALTLEEVKAHYLAGTR